MNEFTDQKFLEFIVKSIVDHPDDVRIERKVDEMGVLLLLNVNPQDMGQIVGREGNTAKAIRSLLRIVGIKNNARVNLKIEEPEGSTRREGGESRGAVEKVIDDIKDM
ncbi:MAG: KH domain-containing protein [Candidatus Colwellbacteria bacterium]|nr:KH domain-containing protein [Candidatus Colwellbacteria bacterium]